MAHLAGLASLPRLRPTTTRVTNAAGQVHLEQRIEGKGIIKANNNNNNNGNNCSSSLSPGIFMVIDTSPDDQLACISLPPPPSAFTSPPSSPLSPSFPTGHIFLSSQDGASSLSQLNQCKITHIINVATGVENQFPSLFSYLNVPCLDTEDFEIDKVFDQIYLFINKIYAERPEREGRGEGRGHEGNRILIHCNAGISRCSTVLISYFMRQWGMSYEDSYNYIREQRKVIKPNRGFIEKLKLYQEQIKNSN